MLPRLDDLNYLMRLLEEEQKRTEGDDFGYPENVQLGRLQVWASIAREAKMHNGGVLLEKPE